MKKRFAFAILMLLLLYLLAWPVPVDPAAWTPSPAPALEGPFALNERLSPLEVLFPGLCPQCEDVAVDSLGRIYGGTSTGRILRFDNAADPEPEVFATTGGRPLGLHFDRRGMLLVADAAKGLLSVDTQGVVKVLANAFEGEPFRFADDLETGPDGMIYFSDASLKFGVADYKLDLLEHRPNGRLYRYDPATQQLRLLLDSLYFANGIAVSPDGRFLLVNETGAYRVRRLWLQGPDAGRSDFLIENLPAFPDGISTGSAGIFWLALISPRSSLVDGLMPRPFLRRIIARLPEFLKPAPENYGFVLGLDAGGRVIYNLQDPSGKFAQISSVQEADGYLFLGSLGFDGIGRIPRPGSGKGQ